jgi:ABC-type multidrug transport system fused ATPase/permease subunit
LDAAAEQAVIEALRRAAAGRTTFIIAHRFSTVRLADRIIVLDEGEVVEQGTQKELLSRDGKYACLYNLQMFAESEGRNVTVQEAASRD